MSVKEDSIWDLLDEYADIRDGLEDTLQSFQILHYELSCAMDDIRDEIDALEVGLEKCSRRLMRFKRPEHLKCEDDNVQDELPFADET
ncbi:hypothetical protein NXH76_20905 [Blautia schinkii]|nr:hypothetical protein [Blautia schinkii]